MAKVFIFMVVFMPLARTLHLQKKLVSQVPKPHRIITKATLDGNLAGSKANPSFKYDEAAMRGPFDRVFMSLFRAKLAKELDVSDQEFPPGYCGLMQMIRLLHSSTTKEGVVEASQRTLRSLFPDWPPFAPKEKVGLLWWFGVLFAKPFPGFSARLNAWVTWWAAQWLMGPCELEDLVLQDGQSGKGVGSAGISRGTSESSVLSGQRLVVKRCRFLEEAGCASVCVHTCKLPTQKFFNEDMSVPMRMLPDYETYECVFEFGTAPTPEDEADARAVSCFAACPSKAERPTSHVAGGSCMEA
jgi:hypothetical protein